MVVVHILLGGRVTAVVTDISGGVTEWSDSVLYRSLVAVVALVIFGRIWNFPCTINKHSRVVHRSLIPIVSSLRLWTGEAGVAVAMAVRLLLYTAVVPLAIRLLL